MRSIFQFKYIETKLHRPTRSLILGLLPDENQKITASLEQLFEIESALNWCFDRIEIDSILIQANHTQVRPGGEFFHNGIDWETAKEHDPSYWMKLIMRVRSLQKLIMRLPQTVVIDMGAGVSNIGLDLALACDLRIASKQFKCIYDNQQRGLPAFSTLDLLEKVLGRSFAQQLIFGRSYYAGEWHQNHFLSNLYSDSSRDEEIFKTLSGIHGQKSVVRIQQKLALTEALLDQLQEHEEKQISILHAALSAEEWKQDKKLNLKAFQQSLTAKTVKPSSGGRNLKRDQVRLYLVPNTPAN
jgi:enoyl-CoA hydratase/carnithine racemase